MSSLLTYIIVLTTAAFLMGYSKKVWDPAGMMGLLIAILFAGGRYYVGRDYTLYVRGFMRNDRVSWSTFFNNIEEYTTFDVINKITYGIGGRVLTWSVIMAITIIPVYVFLKKLFSDTNLFAAFSLFLFVFYTTAFNVSREFISVAIVCFSIKYVFENKFSKFAICIFIASLFHASAFVSIVLWLFWSHKNNAPISGSKKLFLIFSAAVAVLLYQELVDIFSSSFSFLSPYSHLATATSDSQNRDFYLDLIILVVLLLCNKRMKERDPRLEYMMTLLIISTLIGITGFVHPYLKRIAFYFSVPAQLVISGYLPSCKLSLDGRTIVLLTYVYAVARFTLTAYILKQGALIPYEFRLY